MRRELPREFVLALTVTTRGIFFAHFEGPLSPIDWGFRGTKGADKNATGFAHIRALVDRLEPDVIVLPEYALPGVVRSQRIRRLQHRAAAYAGSRSIEVIRYGRADIRRTFGKLGASTRYEIAQVIASHIDAFAHRLPARPKIWMKDHHQMGLFDAAALALVYFANRGLYPDRRL